MSPINNSVLHKEIDLIQACISRMAHNSFLIKGWTMTILAVVLALMNQSDNTVFLNGILLIPLLSFWWLDTFFLRTEKMYRQLYGWMLRERALGSDELLYDLNPTRFAKGTASMIRVMFSPTLRLFYGIPTLVVIGIMALNLLGTPTPKHDSTGERSTIIHSPSSNSAREEE